MRVWPYGDRKPEKYFRRESFYQTDVKPKWHILKEQERYTLKAICKYKYNFILDSAVTQDSIKNKKLICGKCLRVEQTRMENSEKA